MFKKWVLGCALVAVCASVQAEITTRHSYISFETVGAALQGAKADELVRLTGKITSEPTDGFYVLEDQSGSLLVAIPQELRANMTIERDEVYEILGRVSRLPFEGLRVDAETIKEVTK